MHEETARLEVDALLDSYGGMVASASRSAVDTVILETLEGEKLVARFTNQGWEVLEGPPSMAKAYESSESMLLAASAEFCKLWQDTLSRRLEVLASTQQTNEGRWGNDQEITECQVDRTTYTHKN